jgi:hypothetical protein
MSRSNNSLSSDEIDDEVGHYEWKAGDKLFDRCMY